MSRLSRQRFNSRGTGSRLTAAEAKTSPATPTATATVAGTVRRGVHVADAAGAAPTAAEYLALLTSLRNAGIIASS